MEAFEEDGFIINPNCRCIYCKALQVINKDTMESNLGCALNTELYYCKDKKECEANFLNETTTIYGVSIDERGITFRDREDNLVTYTDEKSKNDDKDDSDNIKYFKDGDDY